MNISKYLPGEKRRRALGSNGPAARHDATMSSVSSGHIDLLHGTALLVQSVSDDGRVQFANDAWKSVLGYSDGELARGVQFEDVIAPDERARIGELLADLLREGGHVHVHTTLMTSSGERVNVAGELNTQRSANGVVLTNGIFRDITEENRERLANERLKLRTDTMLAALSEGVVVLNAAGMVDSVNNAGERILGAPRGVMIGMRLLDLPWVAYDIDGVLMDRATHPILVALRTGKPQAERVLRYPRPDGTELYIATAARPLLNAEGRVEGSVSSFRDVTAEHAAMQALRESEARYRELFERNATVQFLVDVKTGVIVAANRAATDFYQYRREELVGMHASTLSRIDPSETTAITASIAAGTVTMFRRTQYRRDGEAREVEIYANVVPSRDGGALMHTIVIDVTSRVDAEIGRRRLAAILDQTPDVVGMFGLDGQLFYANRAGRRMMNLPALAESAEGAPMSDIPHDAIREGHIGGDADLVLREATAVAAETGIWSGETMLRGPDDSSRIMQQVVLAHRDGQGVLSHYSTILHDITDVRRAEMLLLDQAHELEVQTEELRQQGDELIAARDAAESANVAKSTFLAHMSHELRTPLAAIIGFSRVLSANKSGNLSAREKTFAERVAHNAVRLLGLIDQLLDLSKVEAGKAELDLSDVDVRAIVLDVVADLQGVEHAPGVELVADVPPTPMRVYADATKLRQIVVNLTGNALKFTTEGRVVVSIVPEDADSPLALTVKDSGVGIAPQNLSSIFEPFAQEDSTITRRFGGTGLGLAISRRFCEAMGFTLSVDSVLGEGSTFTVRFRR